MNLILKITGKCVFDCKYCCAGGSHGSDMTLELFEKTVISLRELCDKEHMNKVAITFHGGEPLVPGIKYYEKALKKASDILNGLDYSFRIQTNGYLLDESWHDIFKRYSISPGISIDGCREIHDEVRTLADGSGTYDVVMKNINSLKANGIIPGVIMVYNGFFKQKDSEIFDWLVDNDFDIRINPVSEIGSAVNDKKININSGDYADFLINLFERMGRKKSQLHVKPISDILQAIIRGCRPAECSLGGSCGTNFIGIDSEGNIYPCGRFSDIDALKCGNINETSLYKAYNSDNFIKLRQNGSVGGREICKDCGHMNNCSGGCPAVTYAFSSDISAKNPFCRDYQKLFEYFKGHGLDILKDALIERKKNLKEMISVANRK